VQEPARFTLSVNLKAARAFGLKLPQTLVARADEVFDEASRFRVPSWRRGACPAAHLVGSPANAFRTFPWEIPNCRAIRDGQASALRAKTYCGILLIWGCPMLDRTANFHPSLSRRRRLAPPPGDADLATCVAKARAARRATDELRPSQRLPNPDMCRGTREKLSVLTARFRSALKKSVEGIIEAGRVLIEGQD
jgi:hypothetical protein